jgi:DNA-binding transcriptional ArsR family regulator
MVDLDRTFAALANPKRRAIVARLVRGEATLNELGEPFGISLLAISRHLRVLEDASLITNLRDGKLHKCRLKRACERRRVDRFPPSILGREFRSVEGAFEANNENQKANIMKGCFGISIRLRSDSSALKRRLLSPFGGLQKRNYCIG